MLFLLGFLDGLARRTVATFQERLEHDSHVHLLRQRVRQHVSRGYPIHLHHGVVHPILDHQQSSTGTNQTRLLQMIE